MTHLKGSIGRWQGVGLITTSLLGTSVFILPQVTVDIAASGALWSWVLLVLVILPVALIFAELGKRFPNAGGPSHFVHRAFGRRLGTTIGVLFLFAAPVGTPAAIMMTFEFIQPLVNLDGGALLAAQLAMLALLYLINVGGIQLSSVLQLGLTLAILAVVIALALGAPLPQASHLQPMVNTGVWSAFGIALWAYLGVEVVSHLSEEFKRPRQDFVPAMVIATLLVAAVYLVCTLMVLERPHDSTLAMVSLFNDRFGQGGEWVIGLLGTAAGFATVNTYLASMSRLAWRLAQDGQLPAGFGRLNRHRVPTFALAMLLAVVALSLSLSHGFGWQFEVLLEWVNGVFVMIYLCSMLAALKLLNGRFRVKALLGVGGCLLFAWSLGWSMLYGVAIFITVWLLGGRTVVAGQPRPLS
ncbi:amino acid exporter, AAE family [Ferrimonas sediminum]|uniref:Amino acid exporter, AAE family n=1 Tax=Ferrimonas sediminum TaxID=718193 RepID=A0A1G8QE54_9GAMM|nr:L-methionine/branched-chain amino acid transporter [Ferrimonas sediminum]SDJ03052.1 amino acid exporter, AAE family [Ferrimonas sediminum]